jgi:hypothetical protein
MSNIYELKEDSKNYSVFYEIYDNLDNVFIKKYWGWQTIDLDDYQPVKFKLYKSDEGKKNFQMDIGIESSLIILSERAVEVLKDILDKTGQIIPIETESIRKKFYGFYPNKNIYNSSVINLNKSKWKKVEKEKIMYKTIFNSDALKNDPLFVLSDDPLKVYVSEEFKEIVENNNLKGLDFSAVESY